MANKWGGRLRLIPFFNNDSYQLKEMPKGLPMPRTWSKIYEANNGILYAIGEENEENYQDFLHSLKINSKIIYKWISLEDLKIIESLSENSYSGNENYDLVDLTENYFEDDELDFGENENSNDEDFFWRGFQGAD